MRGKFYRVDYAACLAQTFVIQMLIRDLFTVANLLVCLSYLSLCYGIFPEILRECLLTLRCIRVIMAL